MGGAPEAPQRNLGEELGAVLNFLPKFAQKSYGITREFAPKFTGKDIELSKEFAPQYAGLGYDITKQFAPKYAGLGFDITKEFAPQYLGLNLEQMQKNIAGQPLLSELNKQAGAELALQGMPGEDALRRASQQQLAGFAARGNVMGNQSLAADVLGREELVRQRAREAQQFASGVQQLNLGQLAGLGGVTQAPNLAGYAQAPNFAAYAAPGAAFGPMAAGLGAVQGISSPLMGYGSDLFSSNQNAAWAQNAAAANKMGGLTGAGIGAAGSLGAAAIGL